MKKATGYVIKRTVTYNDGLTDVSWVKSVGYAATLSNRDHAKVYDKKKDAQAVINQIKRGVRCERFEIEPVTT